MEETGKPKKKSGKAIYIIILLLLLAVFAVSAGLLIKYWVESLQSQQTYDDIKNAVGSYTRPALGETRPQNDPTEPTVDPFVTVTDPKTGARFRVLSQFAELYGQNPDLVGWISIPGTKVDYPVVQRPESVDYYLNRDFYGKYNSHGCIYVREVCDVFRPSDNITMYGHRMQDMSMFAELTKLTDREYLAENPYIYFDTLTEYHTYKVIYVLTTTASVGGGGFEYHQFVDAASQADFDEFIRSCEAWQLFDTGDTAQLGDKLITLSTCEYTHENGRLVVVAKRVD